MKYFNLKTLALGAALIGALFGTSDVKAIYNLGGQRVAQPTKGLYIVNGKKIKNSTFACLELSVVIGS